MVIPALQTLLDRIETWPVEQQAQLAHVAGLLEQQADHGDWQLSDEDAAEVERRLADENAATISMEEFERTFAPWLK